MRAADWPREEPDLERLLVVEPESGVIAHRRVGDLPELLAPGDVVVVNDAATLPAALDATTSRGERVEVRLAGLPGPEATVVLLGAGTHRDPTERRGDPPRLERGDRLRFAHGIEARVLEVDPASPRGAVLRFEAEPRRIFAAVYAAGRPVQYAHVAGDLALYHVQTVYASRPWAVEMPSAGRPLTFGMITRMRRRGVEVVRVTHGAGLSSTGDAALDRRFPLPERYRVDEEAVRVIEGARRAGGRVVAVGTSVVRALEGAARAGGGEGELAAGEGLTDVLLDAGVVPRVVDGVLSGLHEPGTSHHRLLQAFAPAEALERALEEGERAGYLGHELGDSMLVLPGRAVRGERAGGWVRRAA